MQWIYVYGRKKIAIEEGGEKKWIDKLNAINIYMYILRII